MVHPVVLGLRWRGASAHLYGYKGTPVPLPSPDLAPTRSYATPRPDRSRGAEPRTRASPARRVANVPRDADRDSRGRGRGGDPDTDSAIHGVGDHERTSRRLVAGGRAAGGAKVADPPRVRRACRDNHGQHVRTRGVARARIGTTEVLPRHGNPQRIVSSTGSAVGSSYPSWSVVILD